jgi:hypothetical protein
VSARAAVFSLLTTSPTLNSLGIGPDEVFPAGALDVAPRDRMFLILRWEETTETFPGAEKEILTVWAHCPREMGTDYVPLLTILKTVRAVLRLAEHRVGSDGVLTTVDSNGMSPDLNDEGYKTITKNAAFTVVSR